MLLPAISLKQLSKFEHAVSLHLYTTPWAFKLVYISKYTLNCNGLSVIHASIPVTANDDCLIHCWKGESGSELSIGHTHWSCMEVPSYYFNAARCQCKFAPRKSPDGCYSLESALEDHFLSRTWQTQWWLLCKAYLTVGCVRRHICYRNNSITFCQRNNNK